MKKWIVFAILTSAFVAIALAARPKTGSAADPNVLRVAVLPGENSEALQNRHRSLIAYLSQQIGIPCELVIPNSYEHMLNLVENGQIDLGLFGGLTFLQACSRGDVSPIVMRDIDLQFTSVVVVPSASTATELADLKGASMSFGSPLSTSGHLMPRHFLHEQGMVPEIFFSKTSYSGSHENTAQAVMSGKVGAGAVSSLALQRMLKDGRITSDKIRTIWETPPYANYVWGGSKGLTAALKDRIREAFMALSPANKEHESILGDQNANYYIPASIGDFRILRETAIRSGLLETAK